MIRRGNESLKASAGPRIRTFSCPESRGSAPRNAGSRLHSRGEERRPSLEDWALLLPWDLGRARLGHRWILGGVVALSASLLVLLLPVQPLLSLLPLALGGLWVHRELHSARRRAGELVGVIEGELRAGAGLGSLRPLLEEVLQLDAENDGARFLLACILLDEGRSLSALLQLAPLRDHHPNSGEVLFLAAEAYVELELYEDALRMLGALDIGEEHPCHHHVLRLHRRCRSALQPGQGGPASPIPQRG